MSILARATRALECEIQEPWRNPHFADSHRQLQGQRRDHGHRHVDAGHFGQRASGGLPRSVPVQCQRRRHGGLWVPGRSWLQVCPGPVHQFAFADQLDCAGDEHRATQRRVELHQHFVRAGKLFPHTPRALMGSGGRSSIAEAGTVTVAVPDCAVRQRIPLVVAIDETSEAAAPQGHPAGGLSDPGQPEGGLA